ncbi:hypothetical protein HYV80_00405 [Candidatus Woesearchaeota archaeon]|nr:hypothetical protein [Candidatus Woesearchaeota archaeon]
MAQNRAPHLLLTAVDFLYTDFSLDGKDLIKRMDEIDSETKKVLCSVNSEHSVRGILDDLRSQGIEVFYIRFADVPNNLAALVRSLVGE